MARSGPATQNGKRQERSGEGWVGERGRGGFRAGVCKGGVTLGRRGGGGGEMVGVWLGGGSGMMGWGGEVGIEAVQTRFRDGSSQPRLVSEERCASHQS